MKLLDLQHEKEKFEMDQLARSLAKAGLSGSASSGPNPGRVSEPTTPPGEYGDSIMSGSTASRPSTRFPNASVTSSPGFFGAFASSSTLTSPQAPLQSGHTHSQSVDRFAGHSGHGQSMPSSRRNSEKDDFSGESATTGTSLRPAHPYDSQKLRQYLYSLIRLLTYDLVFIDTHFLPMTSVPLAMAPNTVVWVVSILILLLTHSLRLSIFSMAMVTRIQ